MTSETFVEAPKEHKTTDEGMGPEAHCKHVCVVLITLTRVNVMTRILCRR